MPPVNVDVGTLSFHDSSISSRRLNPISPASRVEAEPFRGDMRVDALGDADFSDPMTDVPIDFMVHTA